MNMSATKIRFFALLLGIALTVIVGIAAVSVYAFECRLSLLSAGPGEAAAELPAECGEADRAGSRVRRMRDVRRSRTVRTRRLRAGRAVPWNGQVFKARLSWV